VCTSGDGVLVSRRLRGDELGEELRPSETLRNLPQLELLESHGDIFLTAKSDNMSIASFL